MTSKGLAILGISVGEAPGAALLVDGRIVAAAQERPGGFPVAAVRQCLHQAGINAVDLDFIALDTVPRTAFNAALQASASRGFRMYLNTLQLWMTSGLHLRRHVIAALGGRYRGPIAYIDRREALAAAADYQCAGDAAAALLLWHKVLGYPPLRIGVNSADGHNLQPTRASDYFHDSFRGGSPGTWARLLVMCANGIARLRGLTRPTAERRAAGEEIPDEIYTLW